MKKPLLLLSCISLMLSAQLLPAQIPIQEGFQLTTELEQGEEHLYQLKLKKGEHAKLIFMQKGVDLGVRVLNAAQDSIDYLDSPNGTNGPEVYELVAEYSGNYFFKVRPLGPADAIGINESNPYYEVLKNNRGTYSVEQVQVTSAKEYQQQIQAGAERMRSISKWIGENAKTLKTVEAENGFEDLQFLKPILQDVQVVGLGEATHGTREFFQLKHRMLEFLVKEMDFRVFAIEASYPGCQNINDYVLHGIGTKEQVLSSQGFWTWDTEEVLEMIEWIRRYNSGVPEEKRIRFVGIDIQVLAESKAEVESFLGQVDTTLSADFDRINQLQDSLRVQGFNADSSLLAAVDHGYNELLADMILNQGRLVHLSSEAAHIRAVEQLRVLMQAWRMLKARQERQLAGWSVRDRYMAENLLFHRSQLPADSKIALWAHNGHVDASEDINPGTGMQPLGNHLRQAFGDAYYTISFAFNKGEFQSMEINDQGTWGSLKAFPVPSAPENTLEWHFAQSRLPVAFLDLRQEMPREVTDYLAREVQTFSAGSGFNAGNLLQSYAKLLDFRQRYDGILYVDTTSRARPTEAVKGRMKVE